MTLTVNVVDRDGGRPYPLETLAPVSGIKMATTWPGGCSTFSCSIALGPRDNPPGGLLGKICTVRLGGMSVWRGVLDDPVRGVGWSLSAKGLGPQAKDAAALDGGGAPTLLTSTAVSAAITRGALNWTGVSTAQPPSTIPFGTTVAAPSRSIDSLLNLMTLTTGKRWGVFADGLLVAYTDPTSYDYLVLTGSSPGGRSFDDFLTHVYALFYDSGQAGNPLNTAVTAVSGTSTNMGRVETVVDARSLGPITATNAGVVASSVAALVGPRASFSGTITVPQGQVLAPNGLPVHNASVTAGKVIRFIGQQPDPNSGEVGKIYAINVLLGSTEYDNDSGSIRLAPLMAEPRDLKSTITAGLTSNRVGAVVEDSQTAYS